MAPDTAVSLRDVSKSFGGVTVLDRINLDLAPGEVHGLVGENGSGKSTLVKILAGAHTPDRGSSAELWGEPLEFPVSRPHRHGMAIIHQDLALVETMSVADNIGITSSFDARIAAPVRSRRELRMARDMAREFGADIDPAAPLGSLSPAERSIVAILRALRLLRRHDDERHLLVLDEPTAALPEAESSRLLAIISAVAANGATVLFISHHLNEILDVCDRITVLRSGKLIRTLTTSETSEAEVVRHMLGYELEEFYPEKAFSAADRSALRVDDLTGASVTDVSFSVREGEILGISGLAGMGQDEIPYLIYGAAKRTGGTVRVDDQPVADSSRAARAAGMAIVPGNRQRDAVWMAGTAIENMTLPFVSQFYRRGVFRHSTERHFVLGQMAEFGTRPLQPTLQMQRFSGGNQQKMVLARWLSTKPKVLLLHEPTQGVDAGAKKELLSFIKAAAQSGTAVVVFSSDTEEIAEICHRVLILQFGRVKVELDQANVSEDTVMRASRLSS
jgi:ribose transport system ATP-binding protein